MKIKSFIQLIIFFVFVGVWYYIVWFMMIKEVLVVGVVGGVFMYWVFMNKGNKVLVIIEFFILSWCVFFYDMMFLSFLVVFWQVNGVVFFDVFKDFVENFVFLLVLFGGIGVDYGVEG